MPRFLVAAIVLLATITLYSLFDCLLRDRALIRIMPRWGWALVILLVPVFGVILWYVFGRASFERTGPSRGGQRAPDDDPDYLRSISEERDAQRRRAQRQEPEDEDPSGSASDSDRSSPDA